MYYPLSTLELALQAHGQELTKGLDRQKEQMRMSCGFKETGRCGSLELAASRAQVLFSSWFRFLGLGVVLLLTSGPKGSPIRPRQPGEPRSRNGGGGRFERSVL